mmetsp:Transcript_6589/g.7983  ORF Transcript_6589/g.7983 Transcript_6589/m.7983 type:complete len:369 (-) Transcript_6589:1645-2751(-)
MSSNRRTYPNQGPSEWQSRKRPRNIPWTENEELCLILVYIDKIFESGSLSIAEEDDVTESSEESAESKPNKNWKNLKTAFDNAMKKFKPREQNDLTEFVDRSAMALSKKFRDIKNRCNDNFKLNNLTEENLRQMYNLALARFRTPSNHHGNQNGNHMINQTSLEDTYVYSKPVLWNEPCSCSNAGGKKWDNDSNALLIGSIMDFIFCHGSIKDDMIKDENLPKCELCIKEEGGSINGERTTVVRQNKTPRIWKYIALHFNQNMHKLQKIPTENVLDRNSKYTLRSGAALHKRFKTLKKGFAEQNGSGSTTDDGKKTFKQYYETYENWGLSCWTKKDGRNEGRGNTVADALEDFVLPYPSDESHFEQPN